MCNRLEDRGDSSAAQIHQRKQADSELNETEIPKTTHENTNSTAECALQATSASLFNSPKSIIIALIDSAVSRAHYTLDQMVILGLFAGIFIGTAGLFSYSAAGDLPSQPGIQKLVVGVTFPIGVMLIVFTNTDLFTGNCMMLSLGLLSGKVSLPRFLRSLFVSWATNILGAAFMAFFFVWLPNCEVASADLPTWIGYGIQLAEHKAHKSWYAILITGIGCNALVCLAIWMTYAARDSSGKILGLFLPIMAFIVCGLEHSIANAFTIPLGMMFGGDITFVDFFFKNMLLTTLGNFIGGCIFLAIWFAHLLRHEHNNAMLNGLRVFKRKMSRKSSHTPKGSSTSSKKDIQAIKNLEEGLDIDIQEGVMELKDGDSEHLTQ